MRGTALKLLAVVVLLGGAAGCEKETGGSASGAASTGQPGSATASAPAGAGANASASASADGTAVCAAVGADLKLIMPKIAEAEAIGPPAGHHAVSAAYSAGAAVIYSHTTAGTGPAAKAAKDLADAMGAIADKYVDAKSKPDKAPLNAAIAAFRTACP